MAKKQDLYTEDITEFIDWITGKNILTDTDVTGGLSVSGGSIRRLLRDKLRVPFVSFEDVENNLYRIFSSKTAKELWLSDRDTYKDLMLFSFVRPSDFELTTDISPNTRYLISGDTTQVDGRLTFTWSIKKGNSGASDSITVIYKITDKDGNYTSFSPTYSSSETTITFDFYKYLKDGTNTVTVTVRGNTTGANSSQSFSVILMTLEMYSNFAFNSKFSYGYNIQIPFEIIRNVTSSATSIMFYIDGEMINNGKVDIAADSAGTEYTSDFYFANIYAVGKHTLQIWAESNINNSTFKSNILYFNFETASPSPTLNYFINFKRSFKGVIPPISKFTITGTQYESIVIEWGYYTDNLITGTTIDVKWKLLQGSDSYELGVMNASKGQKSSNLTFIPSIYTTDANPITLMAYNNDTGDELLTEAVPITIIKSTLKMYESDGYMLKLRSYGKSNNTTNKDVFTDELHNVTTTFTGLEWDDTTGWYNNSLRMVGENVYAVINYIPFSGNPSKGRTIEFEFESEKVNNDNDVIIMIGDETGGHIKVTANSATLYDSSKNEIVHTNFKSNEHVKLAFIINEESTYSDSQLAYIINNGILERAAGCGGTLFTNDTGKITIGKSKSGIRFYGIRVYNRALSYTDEYNNYVFDNDDKATIISSNNVVKDSILNYDLCVKKIDVVLVSGDLSKILNADTDKDNALTNATISRISPFDDTKSFTCTNAAIRKHGQSTLNYPITSMKFWTSKGVGNVITTFLCQSQESLLLTKNRYKMKDNTIPANKFVLQANYADSSGVQNGGLQRMIQKTWYNAKIDDQYRLRTAPQLFTTNTVINHNNSNINEENYIEGKNSDGKSWSDYAKDSSGKSVDFPYEIEVSPDSFPCVVFYQDTTGSNTKIFLGQYVFMEDKKSDYCYGERSIYKFPKDPFCLTSTYKSSDTDDNRIWDNSNVIRIEVLNINTKFSSYLSSDGCEDIITNENGVNLRYKWETDFELIYPDPDDVAGNIEKGTDKFGVNSKFKKTVKPFIDWFKWITGTVNNQTKFQDEAAKHLDLYKLAAYYIYFHRFGLVDTPERNSQIKSYDGVHFHYEPWDMDIGIGKRNTGGIAFNPPIDRNTTLSTDVTVYAMSGRNGLKGSSTYTSNWLWDALEAWSSWVNIVVPDVAQALYDAGLSYDNVMTMFDEEYANKWCEIIYNESGHFKYVYSRGGNNSWLAWLQGASMTYRHWWLSVSMDYYDAKWNCGDFKNHSLYFACDHSAKTEDNVDIITIVPTKKTYFNISGNATTLATIYSTPDQPATYDISKIALSTKVPTLIYGATYIENLDVSCIASQMDTCKFGGSYSTVLGASIKVLNVGIKVTKVDENNYTGLVGSRAFSMSTDSAEGNDAFENLVTLYVRGQQLYTDFNEFYSKDRSELKNLYAMGSGLTSFTSSQTGNKYKNLELPGISKKMDGTVSHSLTTIYLNNSTWENMTFWDTTVNDALGNATFTKCSITVNNVPDYTLNIPESVKSITMLGTTCSNENSKNLVLEWINCIEARGKNIEDYTLILSGVVWSTNTCQTLLTYEQLSKIAKFNNNGNNVIDDTTGKYKMSGYIVIDNSNNKLTAEQLTQIKAWFGDTVFSKNSAGIVIDHNLDYIQINVGDIKNEAGESSITVVGNDIYLKEGHSASLNATKFSLGETDSNDYNWFVRAPGTDESGQLYKNVYLSPGDDHIEYIYAQESSIGNYDVEILCTSNTVSLNSKMTLHILAVTYPDSYSFSATNTYLRSYLGSYVFYKSSMVSEFYITENKSFTATVSSVQFNVEDGSGNVLLPYIKSEDLKGGGQSTITIDDYLAYQKNSLKKYGIDLYSVSVNPDDMIHYKLNAKITFKSGKILTTNTAIIVIDDQIEIVKNDASLLYLIITQKYKSMNSGASKTSYYKSDLLSFTGELNFYTDPVTGNTMDEWKKLNSLKTQNGRSIFKYLPNITSVILDNTSVVSRNSGITFTGDTDYQLVFDKMLNLQTLSVQNCTALTEPIDLTLNVNLKKLDMSGTTITANLPANSPINVLEYGSPESIVLNTPTAISPTNIAIDSPAFLESLELTEVYGNKTFTTFMKLVTQTITAVVLNGSCSFRLTSTIDNTSIIRIKYKPTSAATNGIFGSKDGNVSLQSVYNTTTTNNYTISYKFGNIEGTSTTTFDGTSAVEIILCATYISVNGTKETFTTTLTDTISCALTDLGGVYNSGVAYLTGNIYYMKQYNGTKPVLSIIPKMNGSVISLYDSVSQTYYTNQGSGTLTTI